MRYCTKNVTYTCFFILKHDSILDFFAFFKLYAFPSVLIGTNFWLLRSVVTVEDAVLGWNLYSPSDILKLTTRRPTTGNHPSTLPSSPCSSLRRRSCSPSTWTFSNTFRRLQCSLYILNYLFRPLTSDIYLFLYISRRCRIHLLCTVRSARRKVAREMGSPRLERGTQPSPRVCVT